MAYQEVTGRDKIVAEGAQTPMADWITTTEAAEISGYNAEYIRRLVRQGRLTAQKKGNAWWVDGKALQAYLKTAKKAADKRHGPKSV
jgi:excisionase family DNA binding protein